MPECCRCQDEKLAEDFPYAIKLEAPGPWCKLCWKKHQDSVGQEHAEGVLAWKRDYMRVYMRFRRKREGLEKWRIGYKIIGERFRCDLRACGDYKGALVRLAGKWEYLDAAREMLEIVFCVDPVDIEEHGIGGGRGTRRHPNMMVRGLMTLEEWESGLEKLREEYRVL